MRKLTVVGRRASHYTKKDTGEYKSGVEFYLTYMDKDTDGVRVCTIYASDDALTDFNPALGDEVIAVYERSDRPGPSGSYFSIFQGFLPCSAVKSYA